MELDAIGAFAIAAVAVLTLPIGLLTLLFVGLQPGVAVFVVGWFLLVPVMALVGGLLAERERRSSSEAATDDARSPIDQLQQQYVDGDIDEAEFDRKLDRLLESSERAERDEGTGGAQQERERRSEAGVE